MVEDKMGRKSSMGSEDEERAKTLFGKYERDLET
jgi:hypothetical protein